MTEEIGDAGWLGKLRQLENRSEAAPVGKFFAPAKEALHLRGSTRLGFPANAIESIKHDAGYSQIVSPLFGLSGPVAALPYVYTEQLASAKREHNTALIDFFDMFNHRAQSLLYRALRKYRYVLDKERALAGGDSDNYSMLVAALSGLPPNALPGFAGVFARRTRTAGGLAQMLRRYFELNITIRQFAGRWVTLDANTQSRIGVSTGNNNQLGVGCMLGRRSWQADGFFCVEIHNPEARQFAALTPGGALLHALQAMVRYYAGEEFGFHIEIFAGPALQNTARLSQHENAARLGWRGVLGSPARAETTAIKITRLRLAPNEASYCAHGPRTLVPSVR